MKFLSNVILFCIFIPILFLIVFTPEPCEHEETKAILVFTFNEDKYNNSKIVICKKCNDDIKRIDFKGIPEDISASVKECMGANEIIAGEYYTLSATVFLANYDTPKTSLLCEAENGDVKIRFIVNFLDEFEEAVSNIKEGNKITFRGILKDAGIGFSDAELLGKDEK